MQENQVEIIEKMFPKGCIMLLNDDPQENHNHFRLALINPTKNATLYKYFLYLEEFFKELANMLQKEKDEGEE